MQQVSDQVSTGFWSQDFVVDSDFTDWAQLRLSLPAVFVMQLVKS